jgi:hypothetical protein
MTDAGRKLPEPSFSNPVYYISHSVGQKDVGDAYGGTREIKFEFLKRHLNNALASNGYRPHVKEETPEPTQVLFFSWGMHNRIVPMEEPESLEDTGEGGDASAEGGEVNATNRTMSLSADTNDLLNLLGRAKTIGGQKFADEFATALADQILWVGNADYESAGPLRNFAERTRDNEALVYAIFNDCYFLIVYSMCAETLLQSGGKVRKLLWTTRVCTVAQGISFEATLPIMISNGAFFFGRETTGIEILTKRAYRQATVEIGEAEVVDYISGTAATSGTAAPRTKK